MHECGLLFTENILMTEALYEYSGEVLLAKYLIFSCIFNRDKQYLFTTDCDTDYSETFQH